MVTRIDFRNKRGEVNTMFISVCRSGTVYIESHWFFSEIGFNGLRMCTDISPEECDVTKNWNSLVIKGVDVL
jgi:hypothetical protein